MLNVTYMCRCKTLKCYMLNVCQGPIIRRSSRHRWLPLGCHAQYYGPARDTVQQRNARLTTWEILNNTYLHGKLQTVYLGEYTHPATWEESAHVKMHRAGSNKPTLVYES